MSTITYDFVEGAALDLTPAQSRVIRRAKVKGLTVPPNPQETLLVVAAAIAADGKPMGSAISASYPNFTLQRMRVEPIDPHNPHDFHVAMEYLTPSGFIPTVYQITDGAYASTVQTNLMIDGSQITIPSWTDPARTNITEAEDSPLMSFYRSVRSITMTAVRYGSPTHTNQDFVNYVNQTSWPTSFGTAKPSGAWLINKYVEDTSLFTGVTTYSAEVITRGWQDWTEYATLRSQKTGKYVTLSTSTLSALASIPYTPGLVQRITGAVRVHYYPWINFFSLFGI